MRNPIGTVLPILLAGVLGATVRTAAAENVDPANDDHQYAWGENAGWINTEPSGNGGPGTEVSDFELNGWMWGENIGWISLTCENTATCGSSSYGVVNDGFGVLSGFAWAENVGWINFRPTACNPDPTCGVKISPATGYFSGRAWGENVGWITFASAGPTTWTARTDWCQSTPGPPGSGFTLTARKLGPQVLLSWTALPSASYYDVQRGRLSTLKSSRGNFTVSTEECSASKLAANSLLYPAPFPGAGDGFWFLLRGVNCRGRGTFDTGHPSQVGSRDAEVEASPNRCP